MAKTREATTKLLTMVEEGLLDPLVVLKECLNYMSESEVSDMCDKADYFYDENEEEEEEEEETEEDTL